MSYIKLKINKGQSSTFHEIIRLAQIFEKVTEYKKHFSVSISEEELCRYPDQVQRIISLFSTLQEGEWFNIPDYGTDAWADWMIDLHLQKKKNTQRKGRKKAHDF